MIQEQTTGPFLSVIIPTFNRCLLLKQALDSVLAQSYRNIEIIVADNASTDDTDALMQNYLEQPGIIYRRNIENTGMVANWKDAVENIASGDWFILLSDDDYFTDPHYLADAAQEISGSSSAVLVMANGQIRYEPSGNLEPLLLPYPRHCEGKTIFKNRNRVKPQDFTLCNIIFLRKLAIAQDAFSDPYNLSCDSELFLKMCLYGSVVVVENSVSVYRVHESNLIKTVIVDYDKLCASVSMYIRVYEKALTLIRQDKTSLSNAELEAWKDRVLVEAARFVIQHVTAYHHTRREETRLFIENLLPGLYRQSMDSLKFRLGLVYFSLRAKISRA